MTRKSSVKDHLEARFRDGRIVVWQDPDATYGEETGEHVPDGVTLLVADNDEFSIKHRILREEPNSKFLVYRQGPVPEGTANWLLDVELAYGVFTADRGALILADLGLTAPGADVLI